jgi:hypothetical protein
MLNGPGFDSLKGHDIFSTPKHPDWLYGQPVLLFNGYRVPFTGLKLPEREVNRPYPYSAEVKNEWSYTSIPAVCLHGVERNNFALLIRGGEREYFC